MLDSGDGITIVALSEIGEATERIFGFNTSERLEERHALRLAGCYPSAAGWRRITLTKDTSQDWTL